MPDGIVEPGLQIYAVHPGASAEENEQQVARTLEEELRTVSGIGEIASSSSDDQVNISVRFDANTNMDLAKAEVRDRIERARPKLPSTVREIGIWSWSESDMPVMFFAMLHPGDSKQTDFLIDTVIKRRLEAVDGIGRLELWGVLDDSVRIELDENRVRAAGLDLGALIGRLSTDNFAMPMGEVTDGGGRVLLRSDMRFGTKEQIESYPIGNGLVISDIGRVIDAKSVRNRLFKMDGNYAYFGEVQKESQANVVEVCHRLQAAIDELHADPRLAGEFKFLIFFNQGEFIENSVAQLRDSAVDGGLLSILILFLFLPRVRLTLCMALAIPVSVLLAVAWVFFSGGTLNILTMAASRWPWASLVDNAGSWSRTSRVRDLSASIRARPPPSARTVALAGRMLSTLTTVVVFLPMTSWARTTLRIMFGALACLVRVANASLLAALIFLPVIAARVIGPRHADRAHRGAHRPDRSRAGSRRRIAARRCSHPAVRALVGAACAQSRVGRGAEAAALGRRTRDRRACGLARIAVAGRPRTGPGFFVDHGPALGRAIGQFMGRHVAAGRGCAVALRRMFGVRNQPRPRGFLASSAGCRRRHRQRVHCAQPQPAGGLANRFWASMVSLGVLLSVAVP
jgi:HAE1 family hydrophobic/amphiphilic exporter-1